MTTTQIVIWLGLVLVAAIVFAVLKRKPSNPLPHPNDPPSPLDPSEQQQQWVELLKLEYDKAADRYEHIYQAIWQNFSYMAVVAGGILSFGGKELGAGPLLYFLALTPLFFWLVATFLPMNHYGEAIRDRLRAIEDDINRVYFPGKADPKLAHFKLFGVTRYRWRVQNAVAVFGAAITIFWLLFLVLAAAQLLANPHGTDTRNLQLKTEPLRIEVRDPEVPTLRDSISALSNRVAAVDSLLRLHLQAARKPVGRPDTTHR